MSDARQKHVVRAWFADGVVEQQSQQTLIRRQMRHGQVDRLHRTVDRFLKMFSLSGRLAYPVSRFQ
jgi:hypothetical protein